MGLGDGFRVFETLGIWSSKAHWAVLKTVAGVGGPYHLNRQKSNIRDS